MLKIIFFKDIDKFHLLAISNTYKFTILSANIQYMNAKLNQSLNIC